MAYSLLRSGLVGDDGRCGAAPTELPRDGAARPAGPGVEREVRGEEAQDLLAPSRGEFRQRVKVSEADTDISSSQGAKTNLACRFHKSENFER